MTLNRDWRSLYPFESHWLDLGSLRYHYLDEGRGSPLVMVHGNPTWSFYWRNLITAFRNDHRAVAVDHVGCGFSDKPQEYPYTLAQHTTNLIRLIEHLDLQNITLLAHDWGGAIGLGAAVALPDRFSRIVLFNTGAYPPPFIPLRIRACRTPLVGTFAIRGLNAFALAALVMATERRLPAAVRAGLVAPYDNWDHRVAIDRFVKDIPMSSRHPTWKTLRELYSALPSLASRPVQLIWGMRDWCFRQECLELFLPVFPHAEVHRLADAGHYVVEDACEKIIPLVAEFVKRT